MKKIVKSIAPLQFGKLLAVLYAFLSVIFVPFFILAAIFLPEGNGFPMFMAILMPIFYIVMGFIGGIIGALIYNLAAKLVGGIEIELEE